MEYDCITDRPEVEPNGDISGVGVLVGFMGAAYLAILVLTVYYFLAFEPRQNPFVSSQNVSQESTERATDDIIPLIQRNSISMSDCHDGSRPDTARVSQEVTNLIEEDTRPEEDGWTANSIDVFVLENRLACWLFSRPMAPVHKDKLQVKVERGFRKYMLASCDVQMITGFGILISAFATLGGSSGISVYHWQIVVYLAWFSNLTPLLGLTFLRHYLERHSFQLYWRLAVMAVIFFLLLVALFPTGFFGWTDLQSLGMSGPEAFARCYLDIRTIQQMAAARAKEMVQGYQRQVFPINSGVAMIVGMALLIFTCTSRILKIFGRTARFLRRNTRGRVRRLVVRIIVHSSKKIPSRHPRLDELRTSLLIQPLVSLVLTARLYADFYASTASDIWWAWAAATWVTIRVLQSKASADVDEGDLTFGQSMAVLLMILPTISAGVTVWQLLQWTRRRRGMQPSHSATTSQQDIGFGSQSEHRYSAARQSSFHQLPVSDSSDASFGVRSHRDMLDLIQDSSKSYAQPWSNAAVVLMMSQVFFTTCSFMYTAAGFSWLGTDSVVGGFLVNGSTSIALQPLNCGLIILFGIRGMESHKTTRTGNETRGKQVWRQTYFFLDRHIGHPGWALMGLVLLILSFLTLPSQYWGSLAFFLSFWLVVPWIFYYMYAFTRAMISPTR